MKSLCVTIWVFMSLFWGDLWAAQQEFGAILCHTPGFFCQKIKKNESWSTLFPNEDVRKIVKYINRTNQFLQAGMILAIPHDLAQKKLIDFSPLKEKRQTHGEKLVVVHQKKQVWGAYDAQGQLVRWGPISSGSEKCMEFEDCLTPRGIFRVQRKGGKDCFSATLPRRVTGDHGGAYMPYCIFFHAGYALHGSDDLPGYPASHGCVRLLTEDAQWLYEHFVQAPGKDGSGTKILIQ